MNQHLRIYTWVSLETFGVWQTNWPMARSLQLITSGSDVDISVIKINTNIIILKYLLNVKIKWIDSVIYRKRFSPIDRSLVRLHGPLHRTPDQRPEVTCIRYTLSEKVEGVKIFFGGRDSRKVVFEEKLF